MITPGIEYKLKKSGGARRTQGCEESRKGGRKAIKYNYKESSIANILQGEHVKRVNVGITGQGREIDHLLNNTSLYIHTNILVADRGNRAMQHVTINQLTPLPKNSIFQAK